MTIGDNKGFQAIRAFFDKTAARRDQIVAIVLGTRMTKAVHLHREGGQLCLLNYVIKEAPEYPNGFARQVLSQHLVEIKEKLGAKTNLAVLVLSMGDTVIRHVEMPSVKPSDMRQMLRLHSKNYFQQDMSGYEFDCWALPASPESKPVENAPKNPRVNVLAGGLKNQFLEDVEAAAKEAHWEVAQITVSQACLVNAALMALPEAVLNEPVALIDIGFKTSTISLLANGMLALNRVISMGSDHLTKGLAEALGVTYPVAEGIKTVMPEKVQGKLNELMLPLAQELRTAINFFESQQNHRLSQVMVFGGAARSSMLLQILQSHLETNCQNFDPTGFVTVKLAAEKAAELDKDKPQLAVALGAAASQFKSNLVQLNFLAGKLEAAEQQRRDPVRWVIRAGVLLVILMLVWVGRLRLNIYLAEAEVTRYNAEVGRLNLISAEAITSSKKAGDIQKNLGLLDDLAAKRFLWALPLNALQYSWVPNIQVLQLRIQQTVVEEAGTKTTTDEKGKTIPGKLPTSHEVTIMTITAKDTGHPPASDKFIEAIAAQPYFHDHLRPVKPVLLKERQPSQIDPQDPTKDFILFTIECYFLEKGL